MKIAITTTPEGVQSVDARQLHQFLEVQSHFKDWITRRIEDFDFVDGRDFFSAQKRAENSKGLKTEYTLSISMAKEISMVERSEKGKEARLYFIACEVALRQAAAPAFVIPTTLSGALLLAGELAAKVEEQSAALALAAPKVAFHDTVTASPTVCQLAVACQLAKLKFGRNTLYRKLRERGVLIDGGNRHNLPKQQYVDRGLFQVNESKYNHPKTEEPIITFTTYATQKGIDWLVKTFAGTPVEDCDEPNS
jgi:phage anti-repressor protein/phage antirepressor YoqD-like protein